MQAMQDKHTMQATYLRIEGFNNGISHINYGVRQKVEQVRGILAASSTRCSELSNEAPFSGSS
jgi:hypothetical protein